MEIKKLRIGDWVANEHGFPMRVVSLGDDWCYLDYFGNEADVWEMDCKHPPEAIPISSLMLKANGWNDVAGRLILRTDRGAAFHGLKNRLGYNPVTGELVVNYGSVPVKVLYVHELQHILSDCGLDEYADNFKMLWKL